MVSISTRVGVGFGIMVTLDIQQAMLKPYWEHPTPTILKGVVVVGGGDLSVLVINTLKQKG